MTASEIEAFHRIYDGRDECYDHFIYVVGIVRMYDDAHQKLKANNKQLERLLKRHRLDDIQYELALELSAEDLSNLQNSLFYVRVKKLPQTHD